MFQTSSTSLEVIGEDASITDFLSNQAQDGMTVTEEATYQLHLLKDSDM